MRRAISIFFLTLFIYALTAGGHLYSPDEEVLFRTTRSLAEGEGLAIEPLLGFATRPSNPPHPEGREYAQYGVGQPLVAVPFYRLGKSIASLGSDALWRKLYGADWQSERLSFAPTASELAPRWVCSWFNIFVAAALAALVYLLALEFTVRQRPAWWAAILYAFATLAWPHARPFFTETLATFWICLAWWLVLHGRRGHVTRKAFLAGLAVGLAFLTRADSALAFPGLGVLMLAVWPAAVRAHGRKLWQPWLAFVFPPMLAALAYFLINHALFGGATQLGYADQTEGINFSTPLLAGLFGFLFSVGKGIFFFSPALLLGLWGWGKFPRLGRQAREHFGVIAALALAILVPLVIHAQWQNWPGGWCWGPRHIFIIHAFMMIPVAVWIAANEHHRFTRLVLLVTLLVGGAVQLLGVSQDFIAFHEVFFRRPGDAKAFLIHYDPGDEAYWRQYFQVEFRPDPQTPLRPLPALVLPAPIQDSLYHPQRSMWAGYPRMPRLAARDGRPPVDNLWWRVFFWSPTRHLERAPR